MQLPVDPAAVRRKVWWRIVPLMFILYIVAYLDRVNLGFAQDSMRAEIGFSSRVYGWGVGIFFVGYLLLEIPGALLVERWSARKWFTRILITWGLVSMVMAAVQTRWQFFTVRFLLGLAEAGFFPGVIVYFSHWFPRAERARALSGLVLGVPFSLALGARVSGWLLSVHWLQLSGWQWVFLIEGAPAVLLGIALPFLLTDRPRHARWLTEAERNWLEEKLEQERREVAARGSVTLGEVLRRPTVWLLALGIFAANTGGYALAFWLPATVKNWLVSLDRDAQSLAVMNWTSIVFLCGLAGVWVSGQSSDRTGDRKWHCAAAMVLTGVCLAGTVIPGQSWEAVFSWLCLMGFFAFFWPSPFWVLPTLTLSPAVAAVAIGLINMCANIAGLVGNGAVGEMQKAGLKDWHCLLFLAVCYMIGGLIISFLRVPSTKNTESVGVGSE